MNERFAGPAEHTWTWERLAAYADGQLDGGDAKRVEHHLRICAVCRRDLSIQVVCKARVGELATPEPLPPEAQAELLHALQAYGGRPHTGPQTVARWITRRRMIAYGGWSAAALFAALWLSRGHDSDTDAAPVTLSPTIPMIEHALTDYRERIRVGINSQPTALSVLSHDVGLPLAPLPTARAQLFGAWAMTLRGEPAAALAYKLDGRVIIQYVISESLFFRQQAVRDAVRRSGRYMTVDGSDAVVAWPGSGAGVLLVGAAPIEELDRARVPS